MTKPNSTFEKIRQIVAKIPYGKVATYGQIAEMAGYKDARLVGWAVFGNKDPKIPCHRVVRKDGGLAPNYGLIGWEEQRFRLENEGITFIADNKVDLDKHLWEV
jgi:methylated-DNA-protein-cysteine methyltransferase-like protein